MDASRFLTGGFGGRFKNSYPGIHTLIQQRRLFKVVKIQIFVRFFRNHVHLPILQERSPKFFY
ncbi:MAG: hypothetical protein F6K10_17800 [Moorea sp. SIO2B7]|nr:hypothetical protein [Moorena sp. SIO2B7]